MAPENDLKDNANFKPFWSIQTGQTLAQALWNAGRTETRLKSGSVGTGKHQRVRISTSCPNLNVERRMYPIQQRSFSTTALTRPLRPFLNSTIQFPFSTSNTLTQCKASVLSNVNKAKKAGVLPNEASGITARHRSSCCPCPSPCSTTACPANCLPPPCQTAPRCVQYMTGYYYYPYGWWFCGPYHNAACAPCGPCNPEALRCGACCVVPSAALAAGASLSATDMTFDPSTLEKNQMQMSMYQQQNPQPTYQQQNAATIQNPNAPTPLQNPMFIQETKSGNSRFFSFSAAQNPAPASPKWPPLQQQPTTVGTPKKQPGNNNNMSTLCNQKPAEVKSSFEKLLSNSFTRSKKGIAPTRSQRYLQKQEYKTKTKYSLMSLIAATAGEQKNVYKINKKKVYLSRGRECEKDLVTPLQPYEYTAPTKRRVVPVPIVEPLKPFEK